MANDVPAEKPADRSALEARAQQYCHDAHYLGTDTTGAVHCWSIYHQTVIVFEHYGDLDPELVAIPTYERSTDTRITELVEWCEYIAATRGAWDKLKLSSSTGDQAAESIEA